MTPEVTQDKIVRLWPNEFGISLIVTSPNDSEINFLEVFFGRRVQSSYDEGNGIVHTRDGKYSLVTVVIKKDFSVTERFPSTSELKMLIDGAEEHFPDSPHTQKLLSEYHSTQEPIV